MCVKCAEKFLAIAAIMDKMADMELSKDMKRITPSSIKYREYAAICQWASDLCVRHVKIKKKDLKVVV